MTTIQTGINVVLHEQIGVQIVTADNDVFLDQTLIDTLNALGVDTIAAGTDTTTIWKMI
jgi:hypothetical protein